MSLATLIPPRIGLIPLSITLSETHSYQATVSQHPIEDARSVADHVQTGGVKISIEGVISSVPDYTPPVGPVPTFARPDTGIAPGAPPADAYAQLLEVFNKKERFDLVTGLKTYPNMVFARLSIKRDKTTSAALSFTADLEQLQIVNAQTVEVFKSDVQDKAGKTKDKGKQAAKETPETTRKSAIKKVSDLFDRGLQVLQR